MCPNRRFSNPDVAGGDGRGSDVRWSDRETDLAAGILLGQADGAKLTIPLVARLTRWTRQLKLTVLVCTSLRERI